jgi:hypothetical protein
MKGLEPSTFCMATVAIYDESISKYLQIEMI